MLQEIDVLVHELNVVQRVSPVVVDPIQGDGMYPTDTSPADVEPR